MRLLSLTLKGQYKGLKDQHFDFRQTQGQVVALIGLNGSGKSQLLELIGEIFAFLERCQRSDFLVKTPLGFGFELLYQRHVPDNPYEDGINAAGCYKIVLKKQSMVPATFVIRDDEPISIPIKNLRLPSVVGYASGLNENLQRSFMKNAVQYYEIQRIRYEHTKELVGDLDERQYHEVDQRYLKKYPHVFSSDSSEGNGERKSIQIADTRASNAIYLDYDSASLMLASLAVLPSAEIARLLEGVTFKHPTIVTLRYDFHSGVVEKSAIQDIKLLMRIAGDEACTVDGKRSTDEQFEIHDLDYLSGTIVLDLKSERVVQGLRESNYSPRALFERLYKIQQLGVRNWPGPSRQNLRKDNFLGTVKKPLKTKLPLNVTELLLADGEGRTVCFDDLADGEAQLIQILATVKIFGENTLLLLDEPETHLNPAWRTFFHRYVGRALNTVNGEPGSQVFLSTHSPFMLSSLKREDVLQFERNEEGEIVTGPVDSQTFGASFDVLIKSHFGLRSLISETAVEEVKKHLPNPQNENTQKTAVEWLRENLGESMEKAYLLRKLQD